MTSTTMNAFAYQRGEPFFAQVGGGAEELLADELQELGAVDVLTQLRGVSFRAELPTVARIVYESRLGGKVLAPLASFRARDADELYAHSRALPWEALFGLSDTFAIFANTSGTAFPHSQFASLRLKDALCDRFRERTGARPSVDREQPDLTLSLHARGEDVSLAVELGGGALHRRGYRLKSGAAPMMETLAATLVRWSRWDGLRPLLDPMCGAGTLCAEAHMLAARIPAGYLRPRFGFERLPGFDGAQFAELKARADAAIRRPPPGLIEGADVDPEVLDMAAENLARLPYGEQVVLATEDVQRRRRLSGVTLVTNPPYGVRLGDRRKAEQAVDALGTLLRERTEATRAVVYVGDPELGDVLGLEPTSTLPLTNGGIRGAALGFLIPSRDGAGSRGGGRHRSP